MRILAILFLILPISMLKADEIYNLIKIPNLEVYKITTQNGIRYLNTKNNFRIGIDQNISCKETNTENLKKKLKIVDKNLSRYSKNFLKKNNLKFVVLCENLFISNINTGGITDINKRTLILDINFNKKYFERMIHHELFHMIQNSNINKFDEKKWITFNEINFNYAECSTCTDNINLDLYKKTNGFLTEYSKSIPSEDMAEIFSFLMTNKSEVEAKTSDDKILQKKVKYIKSILANIDKSFTF